MWMLGLIFRSLFLVVLIVMTGRVARPQVETVWSSYETPSDMVLIALGVFVCIWLVYHIFKLPKDPGAFRTWLYLGPVLIPLSLLCAVVIW